MVQFNVQYTGNQRGLTNILTLVVLMPVKIKKLIICLTDRVRRLCSEDTVDKELLFLRQVFINNGSPERLFDKYVKQRQKQDKVSLAAKTSEYISLPFKSETQVKIISRGLSATMRRTFYAANLRISFTSFPALQFHLKDKVPSSAAFFCVHSF